MGRSAKEARTHTSNSRAQLSPVPKPKLFPTWGFGLTRTKRSADGVQGRGRECAVSGHVVWRDTEAPHRPSSCDRLPYVPVPGRPAALPRPRLCTVFRVRKGRPWGAAGRRGAEPGREALCCSSAALSFSLARRRPLVRGPEKLPGEAGGDCCRPRLCEGSEGSATARPENLSRAASAGRAGRLRL